MMGDSTPSTSLPTRKLGDKARSQHAKSISALLLAFAVGVGLTAWAAAYIWTEPEDATFEASGPMTVAVRNDSIGRSIRLSAVVSWSVEGTVRAPSAGTITSQHEFGTVIAATSGSEVFSVDLVAATAATGEVPIFREMSEGDSGPDVNQLQEFLKSQGFYNGAPDGAFRESTRIAVESWETARGHESDGVVQLGQIIFFKNLPTRLTLRAGVETGMTVAPGSAMFDILAPEPEFQMSVPIEQADELEPGQRTTVVHPDAEWPAVTANPRLDLTSGALIWNIVGLDGHSPPCGESCEQLIPAGTPLRVLANVVVVEPLSGPSLPVAAIRSSVTDGTHIQTPQGETVKVTVIASDLGIAILDGVATSQLAVIAGTPDA